MYGTELAGGVRAIAVTGGKGGVGKTTVAIELALALAARGRAVMLFDADLGLANVDVMLGLKPKHTLADVLEGRCELADVVVAGPGGVRVVPGASGIRRMAELGAAERAGIIGAFGELAAGSEVLVVDTPAGIGGGVLDFCAASQEVIVVVCNEPASLTDAYAVIKVLNREYGRSRCRVLVNMVRDAAEGRALYRRLVAACESFLDVTLVLAGIVPFDPLLRGAAGRARRAAVGGAAGAVFKELAARADNWPVPVTTNGGIEFFVERLVGAAPGRTLQS